MPRRVRRAAALATLSMFVTAGVGTIASRPAHASSATLTATPSSKLVDGQFVKVDFSGLPPTIGLAFRECIVHPVTVATDCTATSPTGGVTDGNGSGGNYLQISAGTLTAAGSTAIAPLTITCNATSSCVLAAVQTNTDLNGAVFTPLIFSPSPADCPPATGILGVGSSTAYGAIYRWEGAECLPPANLTVGYTGGAIDDYVQPFFNAVANAAPNTVAFGVTGPVPAMPTPPSGSSLRFKFAPLTTSGLVLAYLMYDNTGAQITSLTLTPDLIAQILLGAIPNWNASAAIKNLNQGIVNFPARIVSYYRAEASSQTFVLSSWLASNAPASWVNQRVTPSAPLGASTIFPSQASGPTAKGVTGAPALGRAVATYAPLDALDQGAIGFMDSSTAAFYGLPSVQIQRPDGSVVQSTTASITKAISEDTVRADGTLAMNFSNPDPAAYPLAVPTYMLAPTNTLDPVQGQVLASFLRYAVQGGQSNEPAGYAPLPPALVNESLAIAASIPATVTSTASAAATTAHLRVGGVLGLHPLLGGRGRPVLRKPLFAPPGGTRSGCTSMSGAAATSPACAPGSATVQAPPAGQHFTTLGDWTSGHVVLPAIAASSVVGVGGGLALTALGRRRRTVESKP